MSAESGNTEEVGPVFCDNDDCELYQVQQDGEVDDDGQIRCKECGQAL